MLEAAHLLWALLSAVALGPAAYLLMLTLLSARHRPPPEGSASLRFDIIVPAHNEEAGIAATVRNLSGMKYPRDLFRIRVVADNCTDETARAAREAGAEVLVRNDATRRGKGYALAHAFEKSAGEKWADAVVVVDADTLASPNLLQAFAARLAQGAQAIQAYYGVANPSASWRTQLMAVAFGMFHGVRSNARERMGVSCGLRGNGMCFSHRVLAEVPHTAFSVVEDVEYGIRLGRAGHRVHFAGEAHVLGEMVSTAAASRSQRQRWEGGRALLTKQFGAPLVREAFARRSLLLLDLALDILVPPLSTVAALCGAGLTGALVLSAVTGAVSVSLWPWLAAGAILASYVLRGWMLSGTGAAGLLALLFAPLYLLWKARLRLFKPQSAPAEWVRTRRESEHDPLSPPAK